jgi:hypothetical protein
VKRERERKNKMGMGNSIEEWWWSVVFFGIFNLFFCLGSQNGYHHPYEDVKQHMVIIIPRKI